MIEQFVEEASLALPVFWPLQSFIATNPLWDLHEQPFHEVLIKLKEITSIEGVMPLKFYQKLYYDGKILDADVFQAIAEYRSIENTDKLPSDSESRQEFLGQIMSQLFSNKCSSEDQQYSRIKKGVLLVSQKLELQTSEKITLIIKNKMLEFLMLYFDRGQTSINILERSGIYECWSQLVADNKTGLCKVIEMLPVSKLAAISQLFAELNVLLVNQSNYLSGIYFQLLGWCSLIKWLEQRPDNPFIKIQGSLVDIALIWLCYEKYYLLKNKADFPEVELSNSDEFESGKHDVINGCLIWQRAYELAYERDLHGKLQNKISYQHNSKTIKLSAQAIFCIDTRSEGIRRHLESFPGYSTYGFAGFFGFVFKYNLANDSCDVLQCPALFPPEVQLQCQHESTWFENQANNFFNSLNETKKSLLGPLAFVEITGFFYALAMLMKSIFPENFKKLKKVLGQDRHDKILSTNISATQVNNAFSLESRVNNSVQFLKTIGLTKDFAPLVLICGHGGETENNPYQASFDCGACGGNAGFANAIVVCHILNNRQVREAIKLQNIEISDNTYFIAGFHNTTRDEITLYEKDLPHSYRKALSKLKTDLSAASSLLRQERMQDLPGHFNVYNRSTHWADLMPEMGLIKNAALIIGPRRLTEHTSLERRVFLHSYEPGNDPDGKLLTGILFGPLIVAHWINAQYYFSTTDPNLYGSGNKMLHNVVSGLGVMEGNFSDLKIGLPWQSIAFRDEILHQPLRLLVVIYAPKALVESLLAKYPTIKALFVGQWAQLKIIEPV